MNDGGAFVPLEGIHSEDYIIATYLIGTERDVDIFKYAQGIAFEQTTGTWVRVPWETEDLRETHGGKVVGIYEIPAYECTLPRGMEERQFIVRLAYPVINLGSNFPLLLTTVAGEISSHGRIKLLDLEFPKRYVEMYKGPRFGIDGVRKILGVFDRPLLLNMIKPCTGFSPEVGAKLLYEVGKGGVDIIKDDELIVDPPFCPLKVRVKKYMEQCRRIYEEIGRVVLYTPNITDRPDKILDHAREAIDAGAKGLMISYLPAGFSSIQVLVES
jgi:2,3-diketo-5-methylthiopentyl-1-phosphate enolase